APCWAALRPSTLEADVPSEILDRMTGDLHPLSLVLAEELASAAGQLQRMQPRLAQAGAPIRHECAMGRPCGGGPPGCRPEGRKTATQSRSPAPAPTPSPRRCPATQWPGSPAGDPRPLAGCRRPRADHEPGGLPVGWRPRPQPWPRRTAPAAAVERGNASPAVPLPG